MALKLKMMEALPRSASLAVPSYGAMALKPAEAVVQYVCTFAFSPRQEPFSLLSAHCLGGLSYFNITDKPYHSQIGFCTKSGCICGGETLLLEHNNRSYLLKKRAI